MQGNSPDALVRTANQLLMAGSIDEAIPAFERALRAHPDLPESWYNLAYLQRCARRFEESLRSYGQALATGVARPEEVHVNRAAILSDHLERGDDAETELQTAVRLNPRYVVAWLNLGNLYEDWGEPIRARAAYEQVLRIEPGNGRALARLTAIDIFEGCASDAPARLQDALARPGNSLEDIAELSFALGNALDAAARYDEAWQTFTAANRAARALAPQGLRYDHRAQEALVDALMCLKPNHRKQSAPSQVPRPLFICGMFRSGSTLAEQILARHSAVTAGGELEFIPALVGTRLRPYPQALAGASEQALEQLQISYLEELRSRHPHADLVTDKRVDNFQHIALIKAIFPSARIVHTTRNPLDNILSIYFLFFGSSVTYGWDLRDIAHWYKQYRRLMDHWASVYGADIHDLPYEKIVQDPEPNIRRLLDFCGLEWEPDCLAQRPSSRPVRTASAWQVRQPLHQRSAGRWKNYEQHLGEVREMLAAP
jgi:tetratricopeptide (TPR) repeat protein